MAGTPPVEITLAHGSQAEADTRAALQRLLSEYDLSDWLWTRRVVIDERAIPHSHPVLTLHTRHLHQDDRLLSAFVHEEYHWYAVLHDAQVEKAKSQLRALYPDLPAGGAEGAADLDSSYLHLIVCYAEHQKLKALIGPERARTVFDYWTTDHYRAIYRLVLRDEDKIGRVVRENGLLPG